MGRLENVASTMEKAQQQVGKFVSLGALVAQMQVALILANLNLYWYVGAA